MFPGFGARSNRTRGLGAAVFPVLAAILLACGGGGVGWAPGGLRGVPLIPPVPEPDFTLIATDGRPYSFKPETHGALALLFFGYTHCPDVCPVNLATLAAALRDLPLEVSRRVRVVFVTVDPARDSAPRLRAWLDTFDPAFVGLRGPPADVNRIETRLNLTPAVVERLPDSSYRVGHAAAVIALISDSARFLYPFGTRRVDWLHDLPKLVAQLPGGDR